MNRGVAEKNEIYERAAVLFQAAQNKLTEIKSKLQQNVTEHREHVAKQNAIIKTLTSENAELKMKVETAASDIAMATDMLDDLNRALEQELKNEVPMPLPSFTYTHTPKTHSLSSFKSSRSLHAKENTQWSLLK